MNTTIANNIICMGPIPDEKKSDTICSSSGLRLGNALTTCVTNKAGNKLISAPPSIAVISGCFSAFLISRTLQLLIFLLRRGGQRSLLEVP